VKFVCQNLALIFILLLGLPLPSQAQLDALDQALSQDLPNEVSPSRKRPELKSYVDFRKFYDETILAGQFTHFVHAVKDPKDPSGQSYKIEPINSQEELSRLFKEDPEYVVATSPWAFSQYPDYKVRKHGYDLSMILGNNLYQGGPFTDETTKNLDSSEKRKAYLLDMGRTTEKRDQAVPLPKPGQARHQPMGRGVPAHDVELKDNKLLKWLACFRLVPMHALQCSKALNEILELMLPSENLTAIPIIKKILSDPLYGKGAGVAAVKIMNKVERTLPGSNQDLGTLYDDIYSSFTEIGLTSEQSEEMTWDLIAVYSARGANIQSLYQFADNNNIRVLLALDSIAASIGVLDSITYRVGHPYSLPKAITTVAHYGKPYHALMSEFLARRMGKKYGIPAAIAATAITQIAYQALSETDGRALMFSNVISHHSFSIFSNTIRVDMAFAFAGAVYGAHKALGKEKDLQIDIDYSLKQAIDGTASREPKKDSLKMNKIFQFHEWVKRVAPFKVYNATLEQTGCSHLMRKKPETPYGLMIK